MALNHTAGLSLPQQVMMALFSLYELMDEKKDYQKACIGIVKKRVEATLEGLGIKPDPNPLFDYYYGVIDLQYWLRKYVGRGGRRVDQEANMHPLDIVFRLAEDYGIVLLNGGGFEAPDCPCACRSRTWTTTSTTTSAGRCARSPAATCRRRAEGVEGQPARLRGRPSREAGHGEEAEIARKTNRSMAASAKRRLPAINGVQAS